jgi:hypothetical protein
MHSLTFFRFPGRATLVFLALCLGLHAAAATLTWTNAAGGSWDVAANWSPNQVPTAGDTALITTPGTYAVTNSSGGSLATLQAGAASGTQTVHFTGGQWSISGTATFSPSAPLRWSGGTWAGTGTVTVQGSLELAGPIDKGLSALTLATPGTTLWSGLGRVIAGSGARWNQSGTATFAQPSSFVWSGFGSGGLLANSGSLTFKTNFTFSSAVLDNSGTAQSDSGTLTLNSSYWTNRASYSAAPTPSGAVPSPLPRPTPSNSPDPRSTLRPSPSTPRPSGNKAATFTNAPTSSFRPITSPAAPGGGSFHRPSPSTASPTANSAAPASWSPTSPGSVVP